MDQRILFVDFDRTLFDTPRFMDDFWATAARLYGFDGREARVHVFDYYVAVGDLAYYDVFWQLRDLLPNVDVDQAMQAVRVEIQSNNYLYDDALQILAWRRAGYNTRILTFENKPFQDYKMSFCPALQGIPRDIVLEAKRDFIAREHTGTSGWLIDDKPNQKLPAGFTEITLDRQLDEPISKKDDTIIVVNSLKVVGEIL